MSEIMFDTKAPLADAITTGMQQMAEGPGDPLLDVRTPEKESIPEASSEGEAELFKRELGSTGLLSPEQVDAIYLLSRADAVAREGIEQLLQAVSTGASEDA